MGLFGTLIEGAMGGFPKKPTVPNAPTVSPQGAQQQATTGNLAALPGLEDLAGQLNTFNQGQRTKALVGNIPGYQGVSQAAGDLLQAQLRGQISPDVASAVQRASNAKAFAGGFGGSGMADNLTARDLGLTSLDIQRQGQAALPSYLNTMFGIGVAPQWNPAQDFITPTQQIGAEQWNAQNQFQRDWLANQLASMPDPFKAAIAKDMGEMTDNLTTVGGILGDNFNILGGSGGGLINSFLGGKMGAMGGGAGGMMGGMMG